MPKAYEAMRDSFVKKGMSLKNAKTKAAKIYKSKHPGFSFVKYYDKGKHKE
jgi:hypothetical protein